MTVPSEARGPARNWIGVRFACHGAYLRVVLPPPGVKKTVQCPVCGREADVLQGPGGSNGSFFEIQP